MIKLSEKHFIDNSLWYFINEQDSEKNAFLKLATILNRYARKDCMSKNTPFRIRLQDL